MKNSDKSKLRPKLIGPYTIITANENYNKCRVQEKNGKHRGLYIDSLRLAKSCEHQKTSKFEIPSTTLKKFDVCFVENILPKSL